MKCRHANCGESVSKEPTKKTVILNLAASLGLYLHISGIAASGGQGPDGQVGVKAPYPLIPE